MTEKEKDQKPQEPLKDVTGEEISEDQLQEVAGGGRRIAAECTTNSNLLTN